MVEAGANEMTRRTTTDGRTYREPLALAIATQVWVVILMAVLGPTSVAARVLLVGCVGTLIAAIRRIRSLTLTPEHLVVRGLVTRRVVPWDAVVDIRAAPRMLGGIVIMTTTGPVRSVVPCRWSGGVATGDMASIREWWHAHAPDSQRPAPLPPVTARPVRRSAWRLARVAPATAVAGLAVAAVNAGALLRPYGEWSAGSMVVTEPSLGGIEALLAVAVGAGAVVGVALVTAVRRSLLSRAGSVDGLAEPGGTGEVGDVLRPSWVPPLAFLGVGCAVALVQWVGLAPAIGALTTAAAGVAAAIGGMALVGIAPARGPVVLWPRPRPANCG